MAGLIKAEDVTLVKERSSLEDVVREHVTLKSAGPRSLKGLCPFHDEKTPSFTVSPDNGTYHCFGCDKGGDVISFMMEVEHLTFSETVERLAGRAGIELHYEDGARPREEGAGRRTRLVEAHRVASEFYAEALISAPDARTARDFLRERGFNRSVAEHFGLGFAPRGGEVLAQHLRDKGFRDDEVVLAGLVGRGRGLYDRFRGRLVWPIHDITGDPVGFGARRIFDDDRIEAKYLNTAETPIYKKTQVLYGLDLAKKAIARDRKAVIVEGYTDVMAAHLAGVEQAVATCGTAFGADHVRTLRRLLRDAPDQQPAKVIYTFDGDAAGQKAAMRAFEIDGQWDARSFVAVAADGQDPCELRLSGGDGAVRALVDDATPMFEFAVRTTLRRFDLDSPEGRVLGARAIAPIIAAVRDQAMRAEYLRTAAGWVGLSEDHLRAEVTRAGSGAGRTGSPQDRRRTPDGDDAPHDDAPPADPGMPAPDDRDPIVRAESQLLECLLQFPRERAGAGAGRRARLRLHRARPPIALRGGDGSRAAGGADAGRVAGRRTRERTAGGAPAALPVRRRDAADPARPGHGRTAAAVRALAARPGARGRPAGRHQHGDERIAPIRSGIVPRSRAAAHSSCRRTSRCCGRAWTDLFPAHRVCTSPAVRAQSGQDIPRRQRPPGSS
ncbi:DNA primase [Allobranchiibius sp. GilTou73]|uniref:DNA primase n=1 Tax=Allobranchiibius sp. GilTou73 TaxID=2904523 RepID=UPI00351D1377